MLQQSKYALRLRLDQRLFAVGIAMVVNIVLALIGYLSHATSFKVLGIVFASFSFLAIMVVCIMADVAQLKSVFGSEAGYFTMLAPASPAKIIWPRLILITLLDIFSFAIGITGVVFQSFMQSGTSFAAGFSFSNFSLSNSLASFIMLFLAYANAIAFIIFCCALAKTYIYRLPGRIFLAIGATTVVEYLLSWLNLALIPLGTVTRNGLFISIHIGGGPFSPSYFAQCGIFVVQLIILMAGASFAMKRRMNQ